MTTSAIKARLAQIEAALCPPLVIVDPDTLPDDDERDQDPARADAGARAGSRSVRIFLGGLD